MKTGMVLSCGGMGEWDGGEKRDNNTKRRREEEGDDGGMRVGIDEGMGVFNNRRLIETEPGLEKN
jgi:hypothetical protein